MADRASTSAGTRRVVDESDYLRWTIEGADGYRSLTWFATSIARGKLLIGSHQLLGTMQLSLLQGSWLIDFSGDFTRRRLPSEEDESISDYRMRATKFNDWYRAAVILFPATTLAAPFHDEPPGSGVRTHRWNPLSPYEVLEVQVLLGEAGFEPLQFRTARVWLATLSSAAGWPSQPLLALAAWTPKPNG